MAETTPRGHLLHIDQGPGHTADDPEWTFSIQCVDPASCGGWQECPDEHEVNGVSATDGPYDECPGAHPDDRDNPTSEHHPWCDEDYFTFHGIEHEWRYGYGWTVPYDGCPVADALNWSTIDYAWDIAQQHGAGVHVVDDDWDDTACALFWVRVALPADLPVPGAADEEER